MGVGSDDMPPGFDELSPERQAEVASMVAAAYELVDSVDPTLAASLAEVRDLIGDGDDAPDRARQVRATADGHFVAGRHLRSVDAPDDEPTAD